MYKENTSFNTVKNHEKNVCFFQYYTYFWIIHNTRQIELFFLYFSVFEVHTLNYYWAIKMKAKLLTGITVSTIQIPSSQQISPLSTILKFLIHSEKAVSFFLRALHSFLIGHWLLRIVLLGKAVPLADQSTGRTRSHQNRLCTGRSLLHGAPITQFDN